jgi:hypothetical protein
MALTGNKAKWLSGAVACAALALAFLAASCSQEHGVASSADARPVKPHDHAKLPGARIAGPVSCDRVASPLGNNHNRGSAEAPYRTAQHLADSLRRGQTGCLKGGLFVLHNQVRVKHPGITLTSYPGRRATLRGRLWIVKRANNVTISNLVLDGRGSFNRGPTVDAVNTTFDHVDITNHHTDICLILGSHQGYGRAVHTVIENSRIHDCGKLPATNQNHGIYAAAADRTVIRNNWIYDNADRGIQLYPDAQGSRIYGNVIDANGEGIVISGDGDHASSNNLIEHNLISNSRIRWNVESNWPGGLVGTGNVVRDNCLWPSNAESFYNQLGGVIAPDDGTAGFTALGNAIVNPRFQDEGAGDLQFQDSIRCLGR